MPISCLFAEQACALRLSTDVFLLNRYVTLSNIQSNATQGRLGNTTFISAGAMKPSAAASTGANQCSFASVYRSAKRGGPFIAQPADLPTSSVYVSPALGPVCAMYYHSSSAALLT